MIRMTLTQEVDATPEMIKNALQAWADREDAAEFPFKPGEFCRLSLDLASRLETHPDAPVLVLGVAKGAGAATVAFVNKQGTITPMAVQSNLVRALEDEPEAAEA